jgi:hypothetical protein
MASCRTPASQAGVPLGTVRNSSEYTGRRTQIQCVTSALRGGGLENRSGLSRGHREIPEEFRSQFHSTAQGRRRRVLRLLKLRFSGAVGQ